MSKGILLIALGHENYLRMATALAASIKYSEPDMPIALATDRLLTNDHLLLFDQFVTPQAHMYTTGGKLEFIKAKLYMYQLSPFTETLFLDVDQIVMEGRKLSEVFDELKDVAFTISNTGKSNISVWADVQEVQALYGDQPFWNYHSEFVYFKKGKEVKAYFAAAQKAWKENKVSSATRFAGATMADELAFQIASMVTGFYPHKEQWTPNFWYRRHRTLAGHFPYQLKKDFYTYSIGGSFLPSPIQQNYNNLAAFYFQKLGLQNPYQARHKSAFLPERSKL